MYAPKVGCFTGVIGFVLAKVNPLMELLFLKNPLEIKIK